MSRSEESPMVCLNCTNWDCHGTCDKIKGTEDKPRTRRKPDMSLYECQGLMMTLGDWARAVGIHQSTLAYRIYHKGMTMEEALSKVPKDTRHSPQLYTVGNRAMTMREWADMLGRSETSMYNLLAKGWTMPEIERQKALRDDVEGFIVGQGKRLQRGNRAKDMRKGRT